MKIPLDRAELPLLDREIDYFNRNLLGFYNWNPQPMGIQLYVETSITADRNYVFLLQAGSECIQLNFPYVYKILDKDEE